MGLIEKPRILMVVAQYPPPVVGGLEKQAHELSKALHRSGHQIIVISGAMTERPYRPVEVVEGITVYRIRWAKNAMTRMVISIPVLLFTMWKLRNQYDVVHVHSISRYGISAITWAKFLGKPVLVKLMNVGDFGLPGVFRKPLGAFLAKQILKADSIVAMTRESTVELLEAGFPEKRIFRITNGINASVEGTNKKATDIITVIFVGRLSPEKGCLDLLSAWKTVVEKCADRVRLTVCGDGPDGIAIRHRIDELELGASVRPYGHVKNVYSELFKSDIFVLPSYAEGNSNAILEAMAAGLPVVTTPVGGTPLLVGPAGAKFLFQPGRSDQLASLLIKLIDDSVLRSGLGQAMQQRIHDHFSLDRVALLYSKVYDALASGNRETIHGLSSPVFMDFYAMTGK